MDERIKELAKIQIEKLKILTPFVIGLGGGVFTLLSTGNFTLQRSIFIFLSIVAFLVFAINWIRVYNKLEHLERKIEGGKND